ncbi:MULTISPECIES: hypothetical protein [Luteibacter]|uniref:hypothetical protein n=1 Tax=Luteibacter sp. dw_328 TaxID=2719796 RepID=UPI0007BF2C5E|nr:MULTISPECIES: hypothetical protein [Luteibacter]
MPRIPREGEWFNTVAVLIAFLAFLAPQIHAHRLYLAVAFVFIFTFVLGFLRAERDFDRSRLPATPLGRVGFFAGLSVVIAVGSALVSWIFLVVWPAACSSTACVAFRSLLR